MLIQIHKDALALQHLLDLQQLEEVLIQVPDLQDRLRLEEVLTAQALDQQDLQQREEAPIQVADLQGLRLLEEVLVVHQTTITTLVVVIEVQADLVQLHVLLQVEVQAEAQEVLDLQAEDVAKIIKKETLYMK